MRSRAVATDRRRKSVVWFRRRAKGKKMFKKTDKALGASAQPSAADARLDANRPLAKATSIIGPTVEFRGQLSADEDLVIEGKVEGTIAHHYKNLTVGKQGRVKADIRAKSVTIRGTVEGDVHSEEFILLAKGSRLTGNLFAPRVQMEDGAIFRGSMDTTERDAGIAAAREPQIVRGTGR
jgi:cytoskeletal protein CcmA (bactofilin family)